MLTRMQVRRRPTYAVEELDWLAADLQASNVNCPKTVIFAHSINAVADVYGWLLNRLKRHAYRDGVVDPRQALVTMFHAHVSPALQQHVLDTFRQADSTLRVVICTIAFGMGVEIPDVRRVVHWGRVTSLLSFWQQVGRCGRHGLPAEAIWYPRSVTAGEDQTVLQAMKTGGRCLRRTILEAFVLQPTDADQLDTLRMVVQQRVHVRLSGSCGPLTNVVKLSISFICRHGPLTVWVYFHVFRPRRGHDQVFECGLFARGMVPPVMCERSERSNRRLVVQQRMSRH